MFITDFRINLCFFIFSELRIILYKIGNVNKHNN